MTRSARDEIRLGAFTLEAIVGIYPEERRTPQRLVADVALQLDLTSAARSGDVARTHDYARLQREIAYILTEARFRLLESAALTLLEHVLLPSAPAAPRVELATVSLSKPDILGGSALPTVSLTRTPDDLAPRKITSAAGSFVLLYEGPEAIVLRSFGPLAKLPDGIDAWPLGASDRARSAPPLELAGGGLLAVVRSPA